MQFPTLARHVVAMAPAADTPAATGNTGIHDTIEQINERWNDAFNRGDAAGVAALYADDALLLPPGKDVVSGRAGIREFWAGVVSGGFTEHRIEIVDVRGDGDVAYEAARWQATGPAEGDGGQRRYAGNLVCILRRQADGSWKSQLHSWN